jgi:hypothetical protein
MGLERIIEGRAKLTGGTNVVEEAKPAPKGARSSKAVVKN